MPHYVIRLTHTSDQCPTSNSKVRAMVEKGLPEMPKLADQLGVKFIAGPYVLAAEHDAVAIVDAPTAEVVNDFLMRGGMVQWNSARVSVAIPMSDALAELKNVPPPLY